MEKINNIYVMKPLDEIAKLIESNYKRSRVHAIDLSGNNLDYLTLDCMFSRSGMHPLVALRVLNKYPDIRVVHFTTGGWIEGVYTRNTLKYGGYKVK